MKLFGFFTYPGRLNDLFADAVDVWLALGDQDALEISCNTVKTAAEKQRESMITYVTKVDEMFESMEREMGGLPDTLPSGEKFANLTLIRDRRETLLQQIQRMQDTSLMAARKSMKRENERAVQNADTSFFRSRYPSFPLWADG